MGQMPQGTLRADHGDVCRGGAGVLTLLLGLKNQVKDHETLDGIINESSIIIICKLNIYKHSQTIMKPS